MLNNNDNTVGAFDWHWNLTAPFSLKIGKIRDLHANLMEMAIFIINFFAAAVVIVIYPKGCAKNTFDKFSLCEFNFK